MQLSFLTLSRDQNNPSLESNKLCGDTKKVILCFLRHKFVKKKLYYILLLLIFFVSFDEYSFLVEWLNKAGYNFEIMLHLYLFSFCFWFCSIVNLYEFVAWLVFMLKSQFIGNDRKLFFFLIFIEKRFATL